MSDSHKYCPSLTAYQRRKTIEVNIGGVPLGGENPIRVQSMTTIDTMDTEGSIAQSIRMVESGCEYVRITAPSIKEAQNLEEIRKGLRAKGYDVPLVADIHFTPNAAELAAKIVEKVRVNPGNYADKKKFEELAYTDETYQLELERIREKFEPLVKICKENGTAMRIGTNHGSLSDRIMGRFGDTPLGMVESALEFLRICEDMDYHDIVISMKASNTRVMVQAYRLLVHKLEEEGLKAYPLHLGVTEAGDGEDGRIKSAVGIGALLEDGLGDTVRVSLTEEPEFEAPVAQALIDRYANRSGHAGIVPLAQIPVNPFVYERRATGEVLNFGDHNVPRVIADFSQKAKITIKDLRDIGHFYLPEPDKWRMNDTGADYVYSGSQPIDFMLPNGLQEILDYEVWAGLGDQRNKYPLLLVDQLSEVAQDQVVFVKMEAHALDQIDKLKMHPKAILLLHTDNTHAMASLRRFIFELTIKAVELPVVINWHQEISDTEDFQLASATDIGGLLIDGLGDGVMLAGNGNKKVENATAFGILQAARTRMTKTEYISCPSCGRTLFDLQETTAMIRKRTDHLKGVKIGIMGCIVNGPGEMADADYGYVGSGKDKITLYRGQEVMKRAVHSDYAVDELIQIIKDDGNWVEPEEIEVIQD
ncbi:(E)-4-hydroxy-3-methylbut-2-enyl-diphosphate synthase [Reichenbachiella carrageenanivorans]|uniref:4-hydroxy-3-methylbut-2-en-1-yl diphosphate synthase (flavodoxin) n=1 Tax=Reichenbachiella carrageenanivorans TaxID=2979869 RepID=A0ABY6D1W8_9BACT|nr:(E)-4-hydroxy-3-methylbut-2-enyl-diphosphate synthase [Reichenbachiella carrageenanivorans]UXX79914.1 (E)-4-hydroxy-3-methylbut-2-enyl-diphosphate synthase [Reichenbachiella carrageenanivorans]